MGVFYYKIRKSERKQLKEHEKNEFERVMNLENAESTLMTNSLTSSIDFSTVNQEYG